MQVDQRSATALSRPRRVRMALLGIVTIHVCLLAWSATRHSPTYDEPAHLVAGLSHLQFGRFDLYSVNPPLVRVVAALPVKLARDPQIEWDAYVADPTARSEVRLGERFIAKYGMESLQLFFMARWACIPFSVLGAWVCFRWAEEVFGERSGLLAAVLWCFSPTILGLGQLITPDVPSAAMGVWAWYSFRRWLVASGWLNAVMAGVAIGLTLLTKSTWLVLLPLFPLTWLALGCSRSSHRPRTIRRESIQLVAALTLSLVLLNAFYGFRGTFTPLGDLRFTSHLLAGPDHDRDALGFGNRLRQTSLARCPILVPREYLLGIDIQKHDFERGLTDFGWQSYLFGKWSYGGWWYYYLVGVFVKEPLGGWALLILAAASLLVRPARTSWREHALLLLPALSVFVLASAQTGLSRYVRYVLPAYPFLIIWTSQVAALLSRRRLLLSSATVGAIAWYATSSLLSFPHTLAYFNETVGGWKNGRRVLLDSNIDWGQDLLYLQKWLDRNPDVGPLHLVYFGSFDPASLKFEFILPPMRDRLPREREPQPASSVSTDAHSSVHDQAEQEQGVPLPPGLYAVSVNYLGGHPMPVPDGQGHRRRVSTSSFTYFQEREPDAIVGRTIYLYRVDDDG